MLQDTCIDRQNNHVLLSVNTIPDIALRDTSRWSAFIHLFQAAFVYVQATFCDFRKAFGCIDTSIIFIKLKQLVCANDKIDMESGVQQGSV